MNTLDLILIVLILLFGVLGFRRGFLQTLGGLIGIILASILAGRFFVFLGELFGGTNFAYLIAFILIFAIVIKLVSLVFWALGRIFRIISILPFLQTFEKILGGALGLVEGILILSVLIFFFSKYPANDWLMIQMKHSILAAVLLKISYVFLPLLPEALKKLKGII